MRKLQYLILLFLLVLAFIINLSVGSSTTSFDDIWQSIIGFQQNDQISIALFQYRFPKALTAILAGVALSVSGLIMQTVFRNPLAGPFVLGVSSGAGLGVAIVMMGMGAFGSSMLLSSTGNLAIIIAALVGSGVVLSILLIVSFRIKDIMTILILGILFSSSISAIIGIMQFFSPESMLKAFVIWTMGSLGSVDMDKIIWLAASVFIGITLSILNSKHLNIMMLGENYARTSGMNIMLFRIMIFTATSFLAGGVTAFCGPIGFIGIMVPHIARMITKTTDHKTLIIYASIIGAIIMLVADTVSQMPGQTGVLPINSVTALMGIPVVIWIILKNQKLSSIF
ncbi:MAG: iron ABC transporter permease [Salinivirgaceae bacterium]|nr:iron ABC transporter permease [Salinivirgaceae bacterium]MDY0282016.1 iron ABC transporter permease [Salinivirgaceae bacterium]